MSNTTLTAILCKTRHGEPLATVDLPGAGADLTPTELRVLAAMLEQIAVDAEAQPLKARHYMPTKKLYPLGA